MTLPTTREGWREWWGKLTAAQALAFADTHNLFGPWRRHGRGWCRDEIRSDDPGPEVWENYDGDGWEWSAWGWDLSGVVEETDNTATMIRAAMTACDNAIRANIPDAVIVGDVPSEVEIETLLKEEK